MDFRRGVDIPILTQKRRPASITKGYTAAALFFLSHDVTSHAGLLLPYKHDQVEHVTTMLHPKEHLYNASVYGDIYRYICGGLGVVISQLPPRRVHTCEWEV